MLLLTMRVMTIQIIAVFHLPHHPPPGKYKIRDAGMSKNLVGISFFGGHNLYNRNKQMAAKCLLLYRSSGLAEHKGTEVFVPTYCWLAHLI